MWFRGGRGRLREAETVSFNNKSFGNFNEVRYHARDVTLGNLVFFLLRRCKTLRRIWNRDLAVSRLIVSKF